MAEFAPCSNCSGNKRQRENRRASTHNTDCSYDGGGNREEGRRYQVHHAYEDQCTPTLRVVAGGGEQSPYCPGDGCVMTPRILFNDFNRSSDTAGSKGEDDPQDYIAAYNESFLSTPTFGAARAGGYCSSGDGPRTIGDQVCTAVGKTLFSAMPAHYFVSRFWQFANEEGVVRLPFPFGSV